MRLRDSWAQLTRRYARPLAEDDIIDLREAKILKDRGIVRNLNAQVKFGNAIILKEPVNDPSGLGGGVHSEDNDDDDDDGIDEVDALSLVQAQEAHFRNRLEAQLRRVKLLRRNFDSEDEDDLRAFLEAERRMQEGFGPVDEGEDEDEARLRGDVEEGSTINREDGVISGSHNGECDEESQTFATSSREDEDCSEDPLGDWVHDESTAIYEVTPEDEDDEDPLGEWVHDESTAIYEVVRKVSRSWDTPPSSPPPSSPSQMSDPLSVRSVIRASSP